MDTCSGYHKELLTVTPEGSHFHIHFSWSVALLIQYSQAITFTRYAPVDGRTHRESVSDTRPKPIMHRLHVTTKTQCSLRYALRQIQNIFLLICKWYARACTAVSSISSGEARAHARQPVLANDFARLPLAVSFPRPACETMESARSILSQSLLIEYVLSHCACTAELD